MLLERELQMSNEPKQQVMRMIFALNDPLHDIGLDLPVLNAAEYGALSVFAGMERGVAFTSDELHNILTVEVCKRGREVGLLEFSEEEPPFNEMLINKDKLREIVGDDVDKAEEGFVKIRELIFKDWPLLEKARKSLESDKPPEGLEIYIMKRRDLEGEMN